MGETQLESPGGTVTSYNSEVGETEGVEGDPAATLARQLVGSAAMWASGQYFPLSQVQFQDDDGPGGGIYTQPQIELLRAEKDVREMFQLPPRESFNGVTIPNNLVADFMKIAVPPSAPTRSP